MLRFVESCQNLKCLCNTLAGENSIRSNRHEICHKGKDRRSIEDAICTCNCYGSLSERPASRDGSKSFFSKSTHDHGAPLAADWRCRLAGSMLHSRAVESSESMNLLMPQQAMKPERWSRDPRCVLTDASIHSEHGIMPMCRILWPSLSRISYM